MKNLLAACAGLVMAGAAGTAHSANITPYYLFDGDGRRAAIIQNGVVVNSFDIFDRGYPVAIGSTIWLGNRDDQGAREYTLGGVATGNTAAGGGNFTQLLDGTSNGAGVNYGVECCGPTNSVTVANGDWSNQQVLFNLTFQAEGIAYDLATDHLFVKAMFGDLYEYDLSGTLLNTFALGGDTAGWAYEAATDTLWAWDRGSRNLNQYSKTATLLDSIDVDLSGTGIGNPFGGEMALVAGPVGIPEPGTLALMSGALLGFGWLRRRKAA